MRLRRTRVYKMPIIGKKFKTFELVLGEKKLLVIRGSKGYIMCGYLNLTVAEKFKDVAIKVTGVSSIKDIVKTKVCACTSSARKLGIFKGQSIKEVLEIIA